MGQRVKLFLDIRFGSTERHLYFMAVIRSKLSWNALHIAAWSGDLAGVAEALGSCQIDVDAAVVRDCCDII